MSFLKVNPQKKNKEIKKLKTFVSAEMNDFQTSVFFSPAQ